MSNIVNLNRFRKKKARAESGKRADENRVKFGRTKSELEKTKAEREQAERRLDGHEAEDGKSDPS